MNRNLPSRKEKAKGLWHSRQKTGRAWAKTEPPKSVCVSDRQVIWAWEQGARGGSKAAQRQGCEEKDGMGRLGEGRAA